MSKKGRESVSARPKRRADKRAGVRASVSVEILVHGRSAAYSGQTVDISRTGALLWITDERFIPQNQANNMVKFSERVASELGDSMRVDFNGGVAHREAEVIRVDRKGDDDKGPMLVACRFDSAISDPEWEAMGLEVTRPAFALASVEDKPAPEAPSGPPSGVDERRAAPRVDRILYIEVQGDHGTYRAYALNVSSTGVLLSVTDPQFAPPAEPDQLVRFTKRMGFQFRSGMIIRFLEAEVTIDADVVRVSERIEGGELMIVIGAKFRRPLSKDDCRRLDIEAGPDAPATAAEPVGPVSRIPPTPQTNIIGLMEQAVQLHASDIHIKAGSPPRLRLAGRLMDMSRDRITPELSHAMALELMSPAMVQRFTRDNDLEFAYNHGGVGRFRCSAFRQRGSTCLALRIIPDHIPTFAELKLPDVARVMAERPRGLVLVTGPTGSGKSHSLAAMVNHINATRPCHILTMEDPIEFIYPDVEAHITQREIGRDCMDYAGALKRALRQDPDVILVGELRDIETMSLALTAAETGHLVFATLHTTSAISTPDRIIDVFPPNQQIQIRQQLADSLQGIISQLLVPSVDEDQLVPVTEVVVATEAVRSLIREGKTPQLRNIVQTSGKEGMHTLETSLNDLVKRGVIAYDVAIAKANFPKTIERSGRR